MNIPCPTTNDPTDIYKTLSDWSGEKKIVIFLLDMAWKIRGHVNYNDEKQLHSEDVMWVQVTEKYRLKTLKVSISPFLNFGKVDGMLVLYLILFHTLDLMRNSLNSLIFMNIQYPFHNVIHHDSLSVIKNE